MTTKVYTSPQIKSTFKAVVLKLISESPKKVKFWEK